MKFIWYNAKKKYDNNKKIRNSSQHATNCIGATEWILSISFEIESDIQIPASERISEQKMDCETNENVAQKSELVSS